MSAYVLPMVAKHWVILNICNVLGNNTELCADCKLRTSKAICWFIHHWFTGSLTAIRHLKVLCGYYLQECSNANDYPLKNGWKRWPIQIFDLWAHVSNACVWDNQIEKQSVLKCITSQWIELQLLIDQIIHQPVYFCTSELSCCMPIVDRSWPLSSTSQQTLAAMSQGNSNSQKRFYVVAGVVFRASAVVAVLASVLLRETGKDSSSLIRGSSDKSSSYLPNTNSENDTSPGNIGYKRTNNFNLFSDLNSTFASPSAEVYQDNSTSWLHIRRMIEIRMMQPKFNWSRPLTTARKVKVMPVYSSLFHRLKLFKPFLKMLRPRLQKQRVTQTWLM